METTINAAEDQPSRLEQWLWNVAAKKAAWSVAKFFTAVVTSVVAQNLLTRYGIHIDPQVFMPAVATGTMAALELAHDYLKLKFKLPIF